MYAYKSICFIRSSNHKEWAPYKGLLSDNVFLVYLCSCFICFSLFEFMLYVPVNNFSVMWTSFLG